MANGGVYARASGERPNWGLIAANSFGSALGSAASVAIAGDEGKEYLNEFLANMDSSRTGNRVVADIASAGQDGDNTFNQLTNPDGTLSTDSNGNYSLTTDDVAFMRENAAAFGGAVSYAAPDSGGLEITDPELDTMRALDAEIDGRRSAAGAAIPEPSVDAPMLDEVVVTAKGVSHSDYPQPINDVFVRTHKFSSDVKSIQERLVAYNIEEVNPDGVYGPQTKAGIAKYNAMIASGTLPAQRKGVNPTADELASTLKQLAKDYDMPLQLLKGVQLTESAVQVHADGSPMYNPDSSAVGLFQTTGPVAKSFGVPFPDAAYNFETNADLATQYLQSLYNDPDISSLPAADRASSTYRAYYSGQFDGKIDAKLLERFKANYESSR